MPAAFSFTITAPFWRMWWFRGLSMIILAGIIWSVFYVRIRGLKRKNELARKIDQMRLEALRLQMNPHFIFNSMNSIQHYINSNEKKLANIYLSKFADVMRMIIDYLQKAFIPVIIDINALELYIQLEQLRFENKFDYKIEIDPIIDVENSSIPPMIIQPYVENAIIHGLLNLPEQQGGKIKKGEVNIILRLENNVINCVVEDNGIGRKRAGELKKRQKSHKPVGMENTEARLRALNMLEKNKLDVNIVDLADKSGKALGTRVEIKIPLRND